MKKLSLILFILIYSNTYIFGQNECDVTKYFNEFISVKKRTFNEKKFIYKSINETEEKFCYSDLVNNNPMFFDYILTNFSSYDINKKLLEINDSLVLEKEYFKYLKSDSSFTTIMQELIDKTIVSNDKKDTVTFDEIINVGVKYFSLPKINDEGKYVAQVCAGINGIRKTEETRNPALEAFCFSAIVKNYKSENYSMFDELVKSVKELYKLNLGIDEEERLLRAQGGLYVIMRNNQNFKEMLIEEYEINKGFLPFVLII